MECFDVLIGKIESQIYELNVEYTCLKNDIKVFEKILADNNNFIINPYFQINLDDVNYAFDIIYNYSDKLAHLTDLFTKEDIKNVKNVKLSTSDLNDPEEEACLNKIFEITKMIRNINNINKKFSFLAKQKSELEFLNEEQEYNIYIKFLTETKNDLDCIVPEMEKVEDCYNELIERNKQRKKECRITYKKLNSLKEKLLYRNEEITNIDELVNLASETIKRDLLDYIAKKNSVYYLKLSNEYFYLKDNPIKRYSYLLSLCGIDYEKMTNDEKSKLLKTSIEDLKKIITFCKEKMIQLSSNLLINTNIDIVNSIDSYISKGIIDVNFVLEYPSVLIEGYNGLYNILTYNLDLISSYGINVIGTAAESQKVFIGNSDLIKHNFDIVDKYNINIKSKNLKNYNFLVNDNLEYLISELIQLVDLNKNLELLNSDSEIVNRIKLLNILNLSIYDSTGKISEVIMNKELFPYDSFNLDDYEIQNKSLIIKKED